MIVQTILSSVEILVPTAIRQSQNTNLSPINQADSLAQSLTQAQSKGTAAALISDSMDCATCGCCTVGFAFL